MSLTLMNKNVRRMQVGTLRSKRKKEKGVALVDVLVWLSIFGLALGLIVEKGDWAMDTYRIYKFKNQVGDISTGVVEWGAGKHDLTGLSMASIDGHVPPSIGDGQGTNSFGGNFTTEKGSTSYEYIIKGTKVPARVGARAAAGYANATYDSTTETVTITLGS